MTGDVFVRNQTKLHLWGCGVFVARRKL